MLGTNVLIIRNTVDCYSWDSGKVFAPMIDSIPLLLSEFKNLNFITITTIASRIKIPNRNSLDSFFRYLALVERALRKISSLSRKSLYVEYFYWRIFLRRNKVRKVVCIEPTQSFLRACKDFSISVCEVQHGVVGPLNNQIKESDLFPDYFLSWDERSADNILKKSFYKTTPLIGCSLALYHYKLQELDKSNSLLRDISSKKNILISLQWGLFGPHLYNELELENSYLPRELLEYLVNSSNHFNYLFRLHPLSKQRGEVNQIFDSLYGYGLVNSISELEKVSNIPIYEQLNEIDLHITLYSSITIEAAYLGIPTILLDPALKKGGVREKYFEKEISDGIALTADINNIDSVIKKAMVLTNSPAIPVEPLFNRCQKSLIKFLRSS
jgi:hypothetical protein